MLGHMIKIDKIGFLVHEPNLWAHYSSVWNELDSDRFAIVLTEKFRSADGPDSIGVRDFLEKVRARNYRVDWVTDLLRQRAKYAYVVSNHKISGRSRDCAPLWARTLFLVRNSIKNTLALVQGKELTKEKVCVSPIDAQQYLPLQLGEKQIRFMYGADIGDGWSLAQWNEIYDLFLCHGPNDEEQISRRFSGKTIQMGYPRYDGYFDPDLDVSGILREFEIDPEKRTVLWMPTFGEDACSIPHFAEAIVRLKEHCNFIVRPHPISFSRKTDDIGLLKKLGYRIDSDPLRDMNRLYKIADAVLCDYGGSAFSALYLCKRVALLNVPHSKDWYTVKGSSNLELKECFPTFDVSDVGHLIEQLENEEFWAETKTREEELREKYFANFRGCSSKKAAQALNNVDNLIGC